MLKKSFIIACICLCALISTIARADIVTLKDGTTYEGKIIKENGAQVVMEIVISNIKTTKTFPRYKVDSIEYKELESAEESEEDDTNEQEESSPSVQEREDDTDADEGDDDRLSARERLQARKERVLFMEIPIDGMIGMGSNAYGLKNALQQARRRGVEHIIFTIDSPGGFLYDAIEALKLLKEHDDEFEYHAMVEEGAISAASIYVAASDHIWVRPGARVGGAVAYSQDTTSGAAEVDAKLNSIWAADIAARAQTKGHPPEVFRAMAEPAAELWIDEDGNAYPSRPNARGAQQLDSASTVLTIRADQMVQIGMAKEFSGELGELGEVLDIGGWAEVRTVGIRAMKRAGDEREELTERYDEAVDVFLDALEDFEREHPSQFSDYKYYLDRNGNYIADGPSVTLWRERTDRAVRHCDIMLEALGRMASVNKRAAKIGATHLEYIPDDYGHDVYVKIRDERENLTRNRNIPPSP